MTLIKRKRANNGKTRKLSKKMSGGNHLNLPPVNINDYIDHVLYINLATRTDRKAEIERQVQVFEDGKVTRIEAVEDPTIAAIICCTKSHLKALSYARDANYKNVLILEDDAIWTNLKSYGLLLKLIKKPYDVIMLGGSFVDYNKKSHRIHYALTASSYIVNNSYYDTIINMLEENLSLFDPNVHIDSKASDKAHDLATDILYTQKLQPNDKWYIVMPALMIQKPGYSNIETKNVNYRDFFKES